MARFDLPVKIRGGFQRFGLLQDYRSKGCRVSLLERPASTCGRGTQEIVE